MDDRTKRVIAAVLMVVAAGMFAAGVRAERSGHTESAGETHQTGASSGATGETSGETGGESGAEHATGGEAPARSGTDEQVLGIDLESTTLVTVAVLVSLAAAAMLVALRRRWVLALVALVAAGFAVLDVLEVVHQLSIERAGLAIVAAIVGVLHAAVVAVVVAAASREGVVVSV